MSTKSEDQINVQGEQRYEQVFGETFGMYSKDEMIEFIEPFKVRFDRNGLDAKQIFSGKKCFDAGCGNGRGSLFMLMNGADHVTSFDFSKKNTYSTEKFVKDFGYVNNTVLNGTLEDIPFGDGTFDFVWCNGVIMHTQSPNKCLQEISRILKVNGNCWLYIYGAGGVYWRIIYHLREWLKDINVNECISALKLFRYPTRYVAEFIDDWFATYLRTYTDQDLSQALISIGFEKPELLKYGMDYDTSHRRNTWVSAEEKDFMGDGDLRYLLTKTQDFEKAECLLHEGEYGSDYQWSKTIEEKIDTLFFRLKTEVGKGWMKIALAAHIQRELRIVLDTNEDFSIDKVVAIIEEIAVNTEKIKSF